MGNKTSSTVDARPVLPDYLAQDPPLAEQKFALISYMNDERGLPIAFKIRKIVPTNEQADNEAPSFVDLDKPYNVWSVPIGAWVPYKDSDMPRINEIAKKAGCLQTVPI